MDASLTKAMKYADNGSIDHLHGTIIDVGEGFHDEVPDAAGKCKGIS
jgi:hypothetical protein